jgi:competence protein ComEA
MKLIQEKYKYIIAILGVLVIGIVIIFNNNSNINTNAKENILKINDVEEKNNKKESLYVDLKGAVINPGVYKVEANYRVIDVINLAGGFLDSADNSVINLSKKVKDEMTIIIYTKSQIEDAKKRLDPTIVEVIKEVEKECKCPDNINEACTNEHKEENSKININTATKEELMTLPNIGEGKANDIINYRVTTPFNIIDDIKNVSGIGDSTFEKIKELITV